MMSAISIAMFLTFSIYLTTSFLSLGLFGKNTTNNILLNFNELNGVMPMLMQLQQQQSQLMMMMAQQQQQGVGVVAERDGGLVYQHILPEPGGHTWSSNGVLAQRWQHMQTRSTVDNHNVPTRRVGTMWSACEG
jgi:hypothetical protein